MQTIQHAYRELVMFEDPALVNNADKAWLNELTHDELVELVLDLSQDLAELKSLLSEH